MLSSRDKIDMPALWTLLSVLVGTTENLWEIIEQVILTFCYWALMFFQFVSLERKLLKWKRPGSRFERFTGIHPADRNVLFNGIWLRMARCGVASFFMVGYYFLAVDQLVSRGNRLT